MKRMIASLILTAAVITPTLAQAYREVVVVREVRPVAHRPVVIVRQEPRSHYYAQPSRWEHSHHQRGYYHDTWRERGHGYAARPVGWGDRDRDGIPNRFDNRPNNPRGDQDRDGIPNRWDNRPLNPHGDQDRDGVPNRWDQRPVNPRHH